MNYLGIDIGSSSCKSVVFDELGHQKMQAYREYDIIFSDDGGAELDSDEVIEKCLETIKECSLQVEPKSIIGIGISSQGEAFTAIGKNNQALSHAMVSSDARAESLASKWSERFGKEKLYRITGHTAHPLFTLFKLIWLKENKPEIWSRSLKFLCFEDLLQLRLGLDPAISWSLAGRTMMFDVLKHKWNKEILNTIGIRPEQLAKPIPSGKIAGKLNSEICKKLSLADNAFVVTGGHDQPCAALGSGVTEQGKAMYATGTVECITPAFSKAIFTNDLFKNNLCTYDHTVEGMYVTVAYNLTGGNILKWFRDEFGVQEIEQAQKAGKSPYEIILKSMDNKPSKLMVLPYFTSSGTPYFDTKTKGAILGLRLSTTRNEIVRALLEGVALEMRLNIDILEKSGYRINELRAVGGGAKSSIWTQLKADVTGRTITTLDVTEAGCLGVAMLACSAHTGQDVKTLAEKWVRILDMIEPKKEFIKRYNEKFNKYKQLYNGLKGIKI